MRLLFTALTLAIGLTASSAYAQTPTATPAAAAQTCPPVPGLADLALPPKVRVVWVGEVHGSAELPEMFGDMVCTWAKDRPVVVALEHFDLEKPFWELFLHEGPEPERVSNLFMGAQWRGPIQDGRDSVAMLALVKRLRQLKLAGRVITVVPMEPLPTAAMDGDTGMAKAVAALTAQYPQALIVVYTGSTHALKSVPPAYHRPSFHPSASQFAADEIVSINLVGGPGGRTWSCYGDDCSEHTSNGLEHVRGIVPAGAVHGENDQFLVGGYDALGYAGIPTTPSPPAMAQALAFIAPIHDAYVHLEAENAKLPLAANDRERLERMEDLDQVGRVALSRMDFSTLPMEQRIGARMTAGDEINKHDRANQAALKAMLPATGWFPKSQFGAKAAKAAFLVVQHATNDPELMHLALARMEPLIASGEVDGPDYALLYDRVALMDHKPQRYGSQVLCTAGKWSLAPLEDPDHVDERRRSVGITQSEADYVKLASSRPCV